MKPHLTRRHFLRSTGALIALPALESLGFRAFAATKTMTPPKRMVFLNFGWGVTNETWFPDVKKTGAAWELSEGLKPLARHQKDITVVQGCSNKFANEAHWGSTFWLTGANKYGVPGKSFSNTISVDQVAAEQFGKDTRFTSLVLSGSSESHGPGLSLAWNRQSKPVAGLDNPVAAFHKLFSDENTPLAQRQAELKRQQSVLDTVLVDARDLARSLGKEDNDKLGEYLDSIRDIEIQLSKEGQWLDVPKPKPADAIAEPKQGMSGDKEIRLMYDLLVAALQTDATRVATYRQPVDVLLKGLGLKFAGHNISHYTPGPRMEASQARDRGQSELLAHLIEKLKATKEPDDSRLFDHVSVALGTNVRSQHYLDNCPTLLTGGGAGIKLGQHIVMPDAKTPLCNVWLTLLNGVGVDVKSFGDSTGVIEQLRA
jgi:hypothetical protein